jgi:hypothetical protein
MKENSQSSCTIDSYTVGHPFVGSAVPLSAVAGRIKNLPTTMHDDGSLGVGQFRREDAC